MRAEQFSKFAVCISTDVASCPYHGLSGDADSEILVTLIRSQVSTLVSLGQVQTEEGYSDDAVETYLQVLSLQQDEDPDEVADAHVQASGVRLSGSIHMGTENPTGSDYQVSDKKGTEGPWSMHALVTYFVSQQPLALILFPAALMIMCTLVAQAGGNEYA